jgi:hypothetical protein
MKRERKRAYTEEDFWRLIEDGEFERELWREHSIKLEKVKQK